MDSPSVIVNTESELMGELETERNWVEAEEEGVEEESSLAASSLIVTNIPRPVFAPDLPNPHRVRELMGELETERNWVEAEEEGVEEESSLAASSLIVTNIPRPVFAPDLPNPHRVRELMGELETERNWVEAEEEGVEEESSLAASSLIVTNIPRPVFAPDLPNPHRVRELMGELETERNWVEAEEEGVEEESSLAASSLIVTNIPRPVFAPDLPNPHRVRELMGELETERNWVEAEEEGVEEESSLAASSLIVTNIPRPVFAPDLPNPHRVRELMGELETERNWVEAEEEGVEEESSLAASSLIVTNIPRPVFAPDLPNPHRVRELMGELETERNWVEAEEEGVEEESSLAASSLIVTNIPRPVFAPDLPNPHRVRELMGELETERNWVEAEEEGVEEESSLAASSLIVTNIPRPVFAPDLPNPHREALESVFRDYEAGVWLEYFPSFRRVRVNFTGIDAAAAARSAVDRRRLTADEEEPMRVFFAQPMKPAEEGSMYLSPPPLEKQFLISPPASPPVGWEQTTDAAPVINTELVARLAALSATRDAVAATLPSRHQLHPATDATPAIIVHTAPPDEPKATLVEDKENFPRPAKLPRTPRPPTD